MPILWTIFDIGAQLTYGAIWLLLDPRINNDFYSIQQKYIGLIFNNKMIQNQIGHPKPYSRKKIQNYSYGLNETIGKGYSSQVYKGRNDNIDEPVAIKVIDLKMLKCEINRTLLASQIDILKSMKNMPHILNLYDVYTTKNNTYIITELCDTDLSRKIKKGLTEDDAYRYMDEFIEGYSHVYEKKLIHRDLKPANLLITQTDCLKIADFGFGIKAEEVLRPSKYNVGSPLYMAPESLKRNQYSFKTDIWAIGIIFFEMLTKDTPWRAKNQKQLLKKIQSEKIDTIINKYKFSPKAKQFILKALNHDKASRLGPEDLCQYNFTSKKISVLGEKNMNAGKLEKFESIINQAPSPKSTDPSKRIFHNYTNNKSQRNSSQQRLVSLQNISSKNIQNLNKKNTTENKNPEIVIGKDQRKNVSKLLISEVHFCRFLYKLLGRIKQSKPKGCFAGEDAEGHIFKINENFAAIIKHKIIKLKEFQSTNFLKVDKYSEYKSTSDYKKLMKISNDYYDRYSKQLEAYWESSYVNYNATKNCIYQLIEFLTNKLTDEAHRGSIAQTINTYNKDIIILDYLVTCKQLVAMIIKDGEDYEKFSKKSRIEEIVEGATSEINQSLYNKIIDRARIMLSSGI